jgi:hypothetical protein
MMVLSRLTEILRTGQFICQAGGLVDQYWQALRTNVNFISLELDGQERFFTFAGVAVQTNGHQWSPKMK